MLTISRLAAYAGCTVKAVRVYHERGLLPEPERDASGYRRYDAQALIDLTRIVTLAQAGVPLADVPALLAADDGTLRAEVARIDAGIETRIAELRARQARLALLTTPDRLCLPDAVVAHLDRMRGLGLSERMVRFERDSWILASAVMPDFAHDYLPVKATLLDDPGYLRVLTGYDEAFDWAPDDPRLDPLAAELAELSGRLTDPAEQEAWGGLPREVLEVLLHYEGDSPAWHTLERKVAALLT